MQNGTHRPTKGRVCVRLWRLLRRLKEVKVKKADEREGGEGGEEEKLRGEGVVGNAEIWEMIEYVHFLHEERK